MQKDRMALGSAQEGGSRATTDKAGRDGLGLERQRDVPQWMSSAGTFPTSSDPQTAAAQPTTPPNQITCCFARLSKARSGHWAPCSCLHDRMSADGGSPEWALGQCRCSAHSSAGNTSVPPDLLEGIRRVQVLWCAICRHWQAQQSALGASSLAPRRALWHPSLLAASAPTPQPCDTLPLQQHLQRISIALRRAYARCLSRAGARADGVPPDEVPAEGLDSDWAALRQSLRYWADPLELSDLHFIVSPFQSSLPRSPAPVRAVPRSSPVRSLRTASVPPQLPGCGAPL